MGFLVHSIGGSDASGYVKDGSTSYTDEIGNRATLKFETFDRVGVYAPAEGAPYVLSAGGVTVFGGSVEDVETGQSMGYGGRVAVVDCVSYEQILDRRLIARVYDNKPAGVIVRDIVTNYLAAEGILVDVGGVTVDPGPVIEHASFVYGTAASALDALCTITGFSWWVDATQCLHFTASHSNLAPFGLSDGSGNWRDLSVKQSRGQYRNRQYLSGGYDLTNPRTEVFSSSAWNNGTLNTLWPIDSTPDIEAQSAGQQLLPDNVRNASVDASGWVADTGYSANVPVIIKGGGGVEVYAVAGNLGTFAVVGAPATRFKCVAGQTYAISCDATLASFGEPTINFAAGIEWYDASGNYIGRYGPFWSNATLPLVEGNANTYLANITAPAGAVWGAPVFFVLNANNVGDAFYFDFSVSGLGTGPVGLTTDPVPANYVFTWTPGSSAIGGPKTSPPAVNVTYVGRWPLLVAVDEPAEQSARAAVEGGTGLYEEITTNSDFTRGSVAFTYAEGLLATYGHIPNIVSFGTDTPGLRSGQLITIQNTVLGLNGQYLITKVKANDLSGIMLRYTVECIDGPPLGSWSDFFAQLAATNAGAFSIGDTSQVDLLDPAYSGLSLADTLSAPAVAYTPAVVDVAVVGFSEVA